MVLLLLFPHPLKPHKANSAISVVFKKPLALFSQSPMTGFYRDGYCRVGPEDGGNHAVAGMLTKEFLDFSASRGNNLRSIGLEPGCKWCLCTARWKEAMEAAKSESDPVVPKYVLVPFSLLSVHDGSKMIPAREQQLIGFPSD